MNYLKCHLSSLEFNIFRMAFQTIHLLKNESGLGLLRKPLKKRTMLSVARCVEMIALCHFLVIEFTEAKKQ
jgi:hypothetical protein